MVTQHESGSGYKALLTTLLETATRRRDHVAVRDEDREDDLQVTYGELLDASGALAHRLLEVADTVDLAGARVALLAEPGAGWVVATWAIWRAGGHAVPLALSHPEPELEHVLTDSDASIIIVQQALKDRVEPLALRLRRPCLGLPILSLDATGSPDHPLPDLSEDDVAERFALLLYTSGTTGRPKGVPIRHRHLAAQIRSLSEAWRWSADDHVLGDLPLHHVHGIVNVVLSALWHGATCTLHRRFDAVRVWSSFADQPAAPTPCPTLFMAVPTIYRRLIEEWHRRPELQEQRKRAAGRLRLMVSGSAALPETTLDAWREISGQRLLERYGMTEIGMALSQPYDEIKGGPRVPGTVGSSLPGVDVRLRGDELEVRGPGVFDGYWRRPDDTAEAFTDDGWFRTGDVAQVEDSAGGPVYRLLGRRSVDILKSGGEKISALEVEAVLRLHDAVADAAVVGLPDPEWGQKVVAFVEVSPRRSAPVQELDALCRRRLAAFKVPKRYEVVEQLPRNALGKVVKGRLLPGPHLDSAPD